MLILNLRLGTGPDKGLTVIGFPSLKKFELYSPDGAYVTFKKRAMPKLEVFEVSFDVSVAETHGFYLGIDHLLCLKGIKVDLKQGDTVLQYLAVAALIRPCSVKPLLEGIEEVWRGLDKILTCLGFNPPQSTSFPFNFIAAEQALKEVRSHPNHPKFTYRDSRGVYGNVDINSDNEKSQLQWRRGSVESLVTDGDEKKKQARWRWRNRMTIIPARGWFADG